MWGSIKIDGDVQATVRVGWADKEAGFREERRTGSCRAVLNVKMLISLFLPTVIAILHFSFLLLFILMPHSGF